MVASQIKPAKLEKAVSFQEFHTLLTPSLLPPPFCPQYIKKKKAELASLDEWTHVNCMLPSARGKIHDDVLRSLIPIQAVTQHKDMAPQLDSPKSRVEKLLAAVDSSALVDADGLEETESWDMRHVRGGQLTYVFERKSNSTM